MNKNDQIKQVVMKALAVPNFTKQLINCPRSTLHRYGLDLPEEEIIKLETAKDISILSIKEINSSG